MYKKFFATPDQCEGPFGPSMVEPCHNLSLEELLRDYTLGIVHTQREALYDEGNDVPDEPPFEPDDISEVVDLEFPARSASRSARADEAERRKQSKNGPGTEAGDVEEESEEGESSPSSEPKE